MKEIAKWKNESMNSKSGSKLAMSAFDDSFTNLVSRKSGKKDDFGSNHDMSGKRENRGNFHQKIIEF